MRTSEEQIILNALTVVENEVVEQERLKVRQRRLERALRDLGLLSTVGEKWTTIVKSDLCIAPLRGARADKFVTALEKLAEAISAREPIAVSPQQLELF